MIYNEKGMLEHGRFYATIEIPLNGTIKYEIDKDTNRIVVDRVLSVAMTYPCNYGYIENTLGSDGDPLDVCVLFDQPIFPGAYVLCEAVGVLVMKDEKGVDEKILCVPVKSEFSYIKNISDVSSAYLLKMKHFFERYKDLEQGKWVLVDKWEDKTSAISIMVSAYDRYTKQKKCKLD